MAHENNNREKIISFADAHLQPYRIRRKDRDGSEEIVPQICPFCHGGDSRDKDTFALSINKGVYVCKRGSCGKHGKFEDLAEANGENIQLSRSGIFSQKQKTIYKLPDTELKPPTDQIYEYFAKRKISKETVDAYKVASDKNGMIVFPFYMNGENVYEKFRRPWKKKPEEKGKEWAFPGGKPVLFGMDLCTFKEPLIITEGMMDCLSLYEAGIHNAVSVPSGCENFEWIDLCYDWLDKFKSIILFGDNDEPGRRMIDTIAKRLDESRCMIVEDYPDRPDAQGRACKDANEILYFYDGFELISMVENAKEIPIKGLIDLGKVRPVDPTTIPRIKTNIPELDYVLGGLLEGSVTVMTGKSGDGKSTLCGQLALAAIEQGYNACAYSGELGKQKFSQWIDLQCAGSDYITTKWDAIRECPIPVVPFDVQDRMREWYGGKFFLFDNDEIFEKNQSKSILDVFTVAARRYGCKLFIVDNLMTALSDCEDETRAQGEFIVALKKFATRFSVHILVVAHPRKTKAGESMRKDDVSGNSAIVNLADSAIVSERPNLRVIKNREGGIQKIIECCYCPDSHRIYQANRGDFNHFSWNKTGIVPFQGNDRADSFKEYAVTYAENSPF